jgi:CHAT domain-containing protein
LTVHRPSGFILFASCHSALSGQSRRSLLGVIGIAPLLVSAGARQAAGTLWGCHAVASLFFNHFLYETARAKPSLPWPECMALARQRLRRLEKQEFEDLRRVLDCQENPNRCFDSLSNQAQPFANPYYWAPFILYG